MKNYNKTENTDKQKKDEDQISRLNQRLPWLVVMTVLIVALISIVEVYFTH